MQNTIADQIKCSVWTPILIPRLHESALQMTVRCHLQNILVMDFVMIICHRDTILLNVDGMAAIAVRIHARKIGTSVL